jgi:hypothetical protein
MTSRRSGAPALTVLVAGLVLLWIWTRFAEFWVPSVVFYAGLATFLVGIVSVLLPLRFLGVRTRGGALLVALAGVAIGAGALLWPVTAGAQSGGGTAELDRVLPEFDRSERHEIRVQGSVDRVSHAVQEVTFSDIRGFQTLMSLRAGRRVPAAAKPVVATMTGPRGGFTQLARTNVEFVAGNIGRPWANARPMAVKNEEEFRSFAVPGYAKIAFNLRVEAAEPGWCKVSTETRIRATDQAARSAFTRYWRVVYPGKALMQVMWLDAVERRLRSQSKSY